jgi:hypothetical protein
MNIDPDPCCHCGQNNLRDQGTIWHALDFDEYGKFLICEDCWDKKFMRMLKANGMAFFMAMDDLVAKFEIGEERRVN